MRFTTTDGRVYDVPDMCAHCQMDTGGNHEPHCPLYIPSNVEFILQIGRVAKWSRRQTHNL